MKEKIKELYDVHVNGKFLYRAMSKEYMKDILKNGLNPKKNPFEPIKKDLRGFLSIILYLHRKGYKISYSWHNETPPITKLVRVLRTDLMRRSILFGPELKEIQNYYSGMKGGSLVSTMYELAELIKNKKYPLNERQIQIIDRVYSWCKKRQKYSMFIIRVNRSSKCLQSAKFQHFGGKYWASPFGSFKHFKKIINREGWKDKYATKLETGKVFYLHLKTKLPASEIEVIK
ncbi:MAG: hypothetical protein WCI72_02350 [archaeon]